MIGDLLTFVHCSDYRVYRISTSHCPTFVPYTHSIFSMPDRMSHQMQIIFTLLFYLYSLDRRIKSRPFVQCENKCYSDLVYACRELKPIS